MENLVRDHAHLTRYVYTWLCTSSNISEYMCVEPSLAVLVSVVAHLLTLVLSAAATQRLRVPQLRSRVIASVRGDGLTAARCRYGRVVS